MHYYLFLNQVELEFALICGDDIADNIEEKFGKMVKAVTSGKGETLHRTLPRSLFIFPILVNKFSKFSILTVKYI